MLVIDAFIVVRTVQVVLFTWFTLDYQSVCVNGARSGAMKKIALTMSRNQLLDQPAVVFYALIGNDVCSVCFALGSLNFFFAGSSFC